MHNEGEDPITAALDDVRIVIRRAMDVARARHEPEIAHALEQVAGTLRRLEDDYTRRGPRQPRDDHARG